MIQQSMATFDRCFVGEVTDVNTSLLLISVRPDSAAAKLNATDWKLLSTTPEWTFSTASVYAVFPWDPSKQLDDLLKSSSQIGYSTETRII